MITGGLVEQLILALRLLLWLPVSGATPTTLAFDDPLYHARFDESGLYLFLNRRDNACGMRHARFGKRNFVRLETGTSDASW